MAGSENALSWMTVLAWTLKALVLISTETPSFISGKEAVSCWSTLRLQGAHPCWLWAEDGSCSGTRWASCCFLNGSSHSRYFVQNISRAKQDHQEFIIDTASFMQSLGLLVMEQFQRVGQQFFQSRITKSVISLLHSRACQNTMHLHPAHLCFPVFLHISLLYRAFRWGSFGKGSEIVFFSSSVLLSGISWHSLPPPSCFTTATTTWLCSPVLQRGCTCPYVLLSIYFPVSTHKRFSHITWMKNSLVLSWALPYAAEHVGVNAYLKDTDILGKSQVQIPGFSSSSFTPFSSPAFESCLIHTLLYFDSYKRQQKIKAKNKNCFES